MGILLKRSVTHAKQKKSDKCYPTFKLILGSNRYSAGKYVNGYVEVNSPSPVVNVVYIPDRRALIFK